MHHTIMARIVARDACHMTRYDVYVCCALGLLLEGTGKEMNSYLRDDCCKQTI